MLTVYADQENSRLAFGKKNQNLRLAQKLIGWNITLAKSYSIFLFTLIPFLPLI